MEQEGPIPDQVTEAVERIEGLEESVKALKVNKVQPPALISVFLLYSVHVCVLSRGCLRDLLISFRWYLAGW